MEQKEKDVQGVALYMEFRKPYQTIQMFITPDGFSETGELVSSSFFRRMVSVSEPKKRWKMYSLIGKRETLEKLRDNAPVEEELVIVDIEDRLSHLQQYMGSLVRGGYTLTKQPIYVEVSKDDLTSISKRDTPTKLVNRIKSVRAALGFPETVADKEI